MTARTRKALKPDEIHETTIPYEISVHNYGPSMRYDKNPEGEEERQINVHCMFFDNSTKYLWRGEGLAHQLRSGIAVITNEDMPLEHAIKLAKMDALQDLSNHCSAHESIYACFAKNLSSFLNKTEELTGTETDRERTATGKIRIIEARTT